MTALESILQNFRAASQSEREKGNYFEELIRTYLRYEATYADVWPFPDWATAIGAPQFGISAKDTGIDPKPMKCAVAFCLVIERLEDKARIESIALAI